MKAIDMKELIVAMKELEEERGIKKDYLIESLEMALVTAYKKNFGSTQNVQVVLNSETGDFHVYTCYNVVEEVQDDKTEIALADARQMKPSYEIGDVVREEVTPRNFGRIAAHSASAMTALLKSGDTDADPHIHDSKIYPTDSWEYYTYFNEYRQKYDVVNNEDHVLSMEPEEVE